MSNVREKLLFEVRGVALSDAIALHGRGRFIESLSDGEERIVSCLECLTKIVCEALVELGEMDLEEVLDELLKLEAYCAWLTILHYASAYVDVYERISSRLPDCLSIAFDLEYLDEECDALLLEALRCYVVLRFQRDEPVEIAKRVLPLCTRIDARLEIETSALARLAREELPFSIKMLVTEMMRRAHRSS